ncbi:MAG: type II/IV secretion system ATPase subunit [Candidatus Heimdallarchaeota archaeon]|nr:type II/IV secretion system ATPase subunit [Candidatus Heimdallarchaeota archaeon]
MSAKVDESPKIDILSDEEYEECFYNLRRALILVERHLLEPDVEPLFDKEQNILLVLFTGYLLFIPSKEDFEEFEGINVIKENFLDAKIAAIVKLVRILTRAARSNPDLPKLVPLMIHRVEVEHKGLIGEPFDDLRVILESFETSSNQLAFLESLYIQGILFNHKNHYLRRYIARYIWMNFRKTVEIIEPKIRSLPRFVFYEAGWKGTLLDMVSTQPEKLKDEYNLRVKDVSGRSELTASERKQGTLFRNIIYKIQDNRKINIYEFMGKMTRIKNERELAGKEVPSWMKHRINTFEAIKDLLDYSIYAHIAPTHTFEKLIPKGLENQEDSSRPEGAKDLSPYGYFPITPWFVYFYELEVLDHETLMTKTKDLYLDISNSLMKNFEKLEDEKREYFGTLVKNPPDGLGWNKEKIEGISSIMFNYERLHDLSAPYQKAIQARTQMKSEGIITRIRKFFKEAMQSPSDSLTRIKREEPPSRAKNSILDRKLSDQNILKMVEKRILANYLTSERIGFKYIDPLMLDPYLEDISCVGVDKAIYIDHKLGYIKSFIFLNEDQLYAVLRSLARSIKKVLTKSSPIVDGMTESKERVNIVFGKEISLKGSNFTIRKNPINFSVTALIRNKTLTPLLAAYSWVAIERGDNFFFAGGTASGKTTTMNAFCSFILPQHKVVSIENTAEVNIPHKNWIQEVTREKSPSGDIIDEFELLKSALRQKPNYIILGEIRGKEGLVAFQAMQTGHFCLSTFHADDPVTMIQRLTGNPINVPRYYIPNLDVVFFHQKIGGIRRIKMVAEIQDYDPSTKQQGFTTSFEYIQSTDTINFAGAHGRSQLVKDLMEEQGQKNYLVVEKQIINRGTFLQFLAYPKSQGDTVRRIKAAFYSEKANEFTPNKSWDMVAEINQEWGDMDDRLRMTPDEMRKELDFIIENFIAKDSGIVDYNLLWEAIVAYRDLPDKSITGNRYLEELLQVIYAREITNRFLERLKERI